jgi:hypothetical protein
MVELTVSIPASLISALDAEIQRGGGTASLVVTKALAQYLNVSVHSCFRSHRLELWSQASMSARSMSDPFLDHGKVSKRSSRQAIRSPRIAARQNRPCVTFDLLSRSESPAEGVT